jgi:hypothetical protein
MEEHIDKIIRDSDKNNLLINCNVNERFYGREKNQ